MAKGLYIDARQLTRGVKMFERLTKEMPNRISDVLNANASDIVTRAKNEAPADRGDLKKYISATNNHLLEKHISCLVPYAAYIEFGTGRYAAQTVSQYPSELQKFAAQFRTGNKAFPPLKLITEWILRQGIVATYSVKTRKRVGTGKSKAERQRAAQMAYVIARSIFINGVHPHPFLIPALIDQQPKIVKDMARLLSKLK